MKIVVFIVFVYLSLELIRCFWLIGSGFIYSHKSIKTNRRYKPKVTVIIPAWNEEVGIEKTVLSVLNGTYKNLEIIVVDDGSTDSTHNRVISLRRKLIKDGRLAKNEKVLRLLHQSNAGKAIAINHGIRVASGELILTVDADSYIEKNCIKNLVKALADKKYSVAIGEVEVKNMSKLLCKIQHYEYVFGFHYKRSQHVFNSAYIFPGALTMFRASTLNEIGDFCGETCTEDLEISMRIKQAGHRVVYVADAICYTEGASTLSGLINQRTRWRHGFLECIFYNLKFAFTTKKGLYLTFIDFPIQVLSVFGLLLVPIIFFLLIIMILSGTLNLLTFFQSWASMIFLLIIITNSRPLKDKDSFVDIALMPLAMLVINVIEYIALLKSFYRVITKKKTKWTSWTRVGADN